MATRIALCITELDAGGAERCLTELAVRLDRRRFLPVVYCLGPQPGAGNASFLPALTAAGVEVHCLGGRKIAQFPAVMRRLRKELIAQRPQIVQTFLFHANVLGRIAARQAGVKTVLCGLRVAERGTRWHLRLDRLTQRWVDRYVCVSQAVADFAARQARLPREKMVVIPNGVDLDKYPAAQPANLEPLGIARGHRVVTFVGRLERQKGVNWLIASARRWLGQVLDCHLVLVGDGRLKAAAASAANRSGLGGRVHFAGWRADVPAILAASDLLVLPSAWEGMPNVVLEAMASRRAVVATDVEGLRELLGPGAEAQTVPYGDTQALAGRIVALLGDPARLAAIGGQNRQRVEANFGISRMITAYEELWASMG